MCSCSRRLSELNTDVNIACQCVHIVGRDSAGKEGSTTVVKEIIAHSGQVRRGKGRRNRSN